MEKNSTFQRLTITSTFVVGLNRMQRHAAAPCLVDMLLHDTRLRLLSNTLYSSVISLRDRTLKRVLDSERVARAILATSYVEDG